jgi:hypothetical protein
VPAEAPLLKSPFLVGCFFVPGQHFLFRESTPFDIYPTINNRGEVLCIVLSLWGREIGACCANASLILRLFPKRVRFLDQTTRNKINRYHCCHYISLYQLSNNRLYLGSMGLASTSLLGAVVSEVVDVVVCSLLDSCSERAWKMQTNLSILTLLILLQLPDLNCPSLRILQPPCTRPFHPFP